MIDLAVRFKNPINFLIFLVLFAVSFVWVYGRLRKNLAVTLWPVVIVSFFLFLLFGRMCWIDHDGTVHLHLSWLMSQGLIPYRDFWQHHSPFLWIIMSPLMKFFVPSVMIFQVVRFFCGLLFIINALLGWRIAKEIWKEKANLSLYLLVLLSMGSLAEYFLLKPDLFMIFFLLCGVSLSLDIPGKKIYPSFLAGIAFSLAASFIIKQYFLVLLPVIAVFLGDKKARIRKWLVYFLGLGVGLLPLYSYLAYHDILGDFIFWVIQFNKQIVLISVYLPLIIVFLGGWGVFLLFQSDRGVDDKKIFIILLAFGLSTLSSLTGTVDVNGNHYLAFWFLLAAIIASGCPWEASFQKIKPLFQRSLVISLFLSLLLMPTIARVRLLLENNFEKDKRVMVPLMKACLKDSCVVIAPLHPVYAWDAVGIYSYWQYDYLRVFPEVKTDALSRGGILFNIKKQKPAVILCRYHKKDFLLELFQKELISASEYKQLVAYIKANYSQRFIDKESYYIRNDKL